MLENMDMSDNDQSISIQESSGPRIVVNISTECEVNSRGTNCTAKTHVRGGFDILDNEAIAMLTHAKMVADAIASASTESLRSSMNSIAAGGTMSQASLDFALAVHKIGGELSTNFSQFLSDTRSVRD